MGRHDRPILLMSDTVNFVGWTPVNTYQLIRRWNEGIGANEIARGLGHSRNAVLSKVKRLGLPRATTKDQRRSGRPAREGQPQFRKAVIAAYDGRCCITGCSQSEILQAAHIVPFSMTRNHTVRNGICLRIDVHSLFDCGLLTIAPDFRVKVSVRVSDPIYTAFDGQQIQLPKNFDHLPDVRFIEWHEANVFRTSSGFHIGAGK